MPVTDKKTVGAAWSGYAFATLACALVFVLRFEAGRLFGFELSLPLWGLAAVIAAVWRAGFAPALLVAGFTTGWYALDLYNAGAPFAPASLHCGFYAAAACAVCIGGRQLRDALDRAAKGEEWQRHLVETAGEGIWMVDADGLIVFANLRLAEILGCSVEKITGKRLEDFLFPDDLPVERVRFHSRRAGVREQFDRRLRRPDGAEVWTLTCSSPYLSGSEGISSLSMMTDITERRNAEQALRRSERKYRELFENIREGVYQTSPDGRILAANPELLRMLGFSNRDELNVPGVVRDTFVETGLHQSLRDRLERDGSYANVEFQLRTRDHRIVTVRENARVVRDESGQILYYEGTLTDITEAIRLEKQLRQAQQMEALGRLAGGIARDFRGIGVGMMSGLQQALDALPPESPVRAGLAAVTRSLHGAAALTRQILDFSQRHERGSREDVPIDVNLLVRRLEPALVRLAGREHELRVSLCGDALPVIADAGHLEQIVSGFVIHARDCGSGAGKIRLTTALEAQTAGPPGPMVSLTVAGRAEKDDGREEDPRPWIGMETTRAILAQYGGTMTAAAEPPDAESGCGVRYSLYLPLATGAGVAPALAAPGAPSVLLVEEEPLIRELSRDMLDRQGFRVLTAGNSAEAARIARGPEAFDVLITAWTRDGQSAAALVHTLREMRPELRVLFVAGYSDGSHDAIAAPEGTVILQKPFSGDSLGRKVRALLAQA